MFSYLRSKWKKSRPDSVSDAHLNTCLQYVSSSYPSNHTYHISNRQCIPKRKLAVRYQTIRKLFPVPLTSLADLGCSKGFFVFSSSAHPHCTRSLGIDVNDYDIEVCRSLAGYLENDRVRFEKYRLHELAQQIDAYGGPFQTVLIVNQYQYLLFGSDTNKKEFIKDLRKAKEVVNLEAQKYASQLRIPVPIKTTTVAPTGTIAQLSGETTGMQPIFSKYYKRRVMFADTDDT